MLVQPPMAGHDVTDPWLYLFYSFFINNEAVGKNMLYDLGIMKAWEAKQLSRGELLRAVFPIPFLLYLIGEVRTSCRIV
jgi:hypothetical protein